jgi:hypothetical protein
VLKLENRGGKLNENFVDIHQREKGQKYRDLEKIRKNQ